MELREIECSPSFELNDDILLSQEPIVLRGLVARWPIVIEAKRSTDSAIAYLNGLYSGVPVTVVRGEPEIQRRIGYTSDLSKINCVSSKKSLSEALELIVDDKEASRGTLHYIGTTITESVLPSFREDNDIRLENKANQYIWLGSRSCISTHYDLPDNIACNVVGRRRFTLFPPEQLKNLYVGPLDFTPAGQAISLVDVRRPDLDRFPKYAQAQQAASVIELDPGDALFLPSMWWHNVEGLETLNVLVNYWWRQSPGYMSSPADVLELALLTIRDLPPRQKKIWKELLDHYIFNEDEEAFAHIPMHARGSVGPLNDTIARKIRAKVLSRLNR